MVAAGNVLLGGIALALMQFARHFLPSPRNETSTGTTKQDVRFCTGMFVRSRAMFADFIDSDARGP